MEYKNIVDTIMANEYEDSINKSYQDRDVPHPSLGPCELDSNTESIAPVCDRLHVTEPVFITIDTKLESDVTDNMEYINHLGQNQRLTQTSYDVTEVIDDLQRNDTTPAENPQDVEIINLSKSSTESQQCIESIENYFCNSIIELSRLSAEYESGQNYFRGCKWSPDGTCILSIINNHGMQISEFPRDLYTNESISSERPVDILNPVVKVKEAGCVYDFCWYPKMNSFDPSTCCWASTLQHGPVQLWDAFDGSLRCTYRGYNEVDEIEAALSVCFDSNGDHIFAGYKKSIKLFDTDRPGRDCLNFRMKYPATCMALSPSGSLLAVGSWRTTITLMSSNFSELCDLKVLSGHKGGVTHLTFTSDSNYLISGARKDPFLQFWDIRYCNKPVKTFCRMADSNQRIYFDVSPCGTWLVTANTNGIIRVWDMKTFQEADVRELNFPVHNDCCNGLSFHPSRPVIATSSGQHHFPDEDDDNNYTAKENSLVLWWIGDIEISGEV